MTKCYIGVLNGTLEQRDDIRGKNNLTKFKVWSSIHNNVSILIH